MKTNSKIIIGGAQFGMKYGIANTKGKVGNEEVRNILKVAKENSVEFIDTAIAYGQSEEVIGDAGVGDMKIITKIPKIPEHIHDIKSWVIDNIYQSLGRLKKRQLYAILLHEPRQLKERNGHLIYGALLEAKDRKIVQKIGLSIYDPTELEPILKKYEIDIIQAPVNIFDQRLIDSGWLDKLKKLHIEVHARSVFLQGLLVMPNHRRPRYFEKWSQIWKRYEAWLKIQEHNAVDLCLNFVLSNPQIDGVVIGIDDLKQFHEIIGCERKNIQQSIKFAGVEDNELLNPAMWQTNMSA